MEDAIELVHAQIGTLALPTASAVSRAAKDAAEADEPVEIPPEVPVFDPSSLGREFDTVVMNPPFGTWNQGIDMVFLEVACRVRWSFAETIDRADCV